MTDSSQSRSRWRRLRLPADSPDLELAEGVHARIAMTSQTMISKVTMTAGSIQDELNYGGEAVIVMLAGSVAISIGGELSSISADEVAIVPAGERYSLSAGDGGCTRLDVFTPPNMKLAEEAFHQEHANHGFE